MKLIDNNNEEKRYLKAKKRIEELKQFYKHLVVYIVVNTFISLRKIIRNLDNGETLNEAFFDSSTFIVWFFWGIAIVLQAFKVFGFDLFMGKNWEEQKIKELMNKK